ncbi:MAG TPA: thioesterase family protein [Acidimicrobiales bacterium]|nr:thioesterase family protein [Acidimicrobiales bacterium]
MPCPFRHELRVRYGEVDMQGHVFNAHYLAFVDDAFSAWLRAALGDYQAAGFDMVVKAATLTWHGGAGFDDLLAIDVAVGRWGTTSFDLTYEGSVGERPVFSAVLTYVSVTPGTTNPAPVPPAVRAALG